MFCTECGHLLNDTDRVCSACGHAAPPSHDQPQTSLATAQSTPAPAVHAAPAQAVAAVAPPISAPHQPAAPPPRDYSRYPAYYQRAFRHFDENPGDIVRWNWATFFFGLLWYLYRGMGVKAVLYFIGLIVLTGLTAGVGTFFAWLLFAAIGTHDYYLKEVKGTQLW